MIRSRTKSQAAQAGGRINLPSMWLLGLVIAGSACHKRHSPPDPRFDLAWRALADRQGETAAEVFYIEDDGGEGLMARVRRGSKKIPKPAPLTEPAPAAPGDPENLSGDEVSSVVRSYLPNVKFCYLQVTRSGQSASGRAIVSFSVDKDGSVGNIQVDAPAFQETDLPRCVSQQVQHWAFPKSQKGAVSVSYPFVFVGG